MLVNIMSLSGTHTKKEPLVGKGSKFVVRTGTYNFLYILDMTAFLSMMNDLKMYKNSAFYTYAIEQQIWLFLQINVNI